MPPLKDWNCDKLPLRNRPNLLSQEVSRFVIRASCKKRFWREDCHRSTNRCPDPWKMSALPYAGSISMSRHPRADAVEHSGAGA